MKLLLLGDVVGKAGRLALAKHLPQLKQQYEPDVIIVNGENAAHGKGMTKRIYDELCGLGIDMITMGNHTFSKNDIHNFIEDADRLVRPANMEPCEIGKSTRVIEVKGKKIAITNLCGEIFMNHVVASPFDTMEKVLEEVDADVHIVDLHAEATSEKIAFTYHFAKRVQVVVGTHTHVQTADERIVQGCAAISDLGMCGAYRSVLGRDLDEVITRFTTKQKTRFTIAEGEGIVCGVAVVIEDITNRATAIERIQIRPALSEEIY